MGIKVAEVLCNPIIYVLGVLGDYVLQALSFLKKLKQVFQGPFILTPIIFPYIARSGVRNWC